MLIAYHQGWLESKFRQNHCLIQLALSVYASCSSHLSGLGLLPVGFIAQLWNNCGTDIADCQLTFLAGDLLEG